MRTAQQCLAKAAELQDRADSCAIASLALDYGNMAATWRDLARQAEWQDAWQHKFPYLDDPIPLAS